MRCMVPHIYSKDDKQYFACKLAKLISLTSLGLSQKDYSSRFYDRILNLLNLILTRSDDKYTFDLRIISRPVPADYRRGRIDIVLICCTQAKPTGWAEEFAQQFLRFLEATFEEYEFSLALARELSGLLRPIRFQHVTEIIRRCEVAHLDTLKSEVRPKRLGFNAVDDSSARQLPTTNVITYIYPYVYTESAFESLFRLLLLERHPIVVSCMLRPTTLPPDVVKFVEDQIAACERYAQIGLSQIPREIQTLYPTLQEQARIYQRQLTRMLLGLKDKAALLQLRLAAETPLPQVVVSAAGSVVTAPAGGKGGGSEGTFFQYLSGGYEVQYLRDAALREAAAALASMEIVCNRHPLFPEGAHQLLYLFDSVEAACAFRMPPSTLESLPGLEMQHWRSRPAPKDLPSEGVVSGVSETPREAQLVRITRDDRRRHMYVVGQTGTGKTTLLKTMILSDIRAGEGLCVVDPHGDLFKDLLGKIPEERADDVVILDPTDADFPIGLNMLEFKLENQRHFLAQEMVAIMTKLIEDEYGAGSIKEFAGPIFFQHMRMNLLLATSNPMDPGTLLEFYQIYQQKEYWKRWLPLKVEDPMLQRWVDEVLPGTDYLKVGSEGVSMGGYLGSKFDGFIFDPMLRNVFAQKRSTINLREVMDNGKILLVNLGKGDLTEANAKFFGLVLMGKIQAAAMERARLSKEERRDFYIYVDEFQNIATENFVTLLSEGRKFRVNLILANQFMTQVDPRIMTAILGNVGTIVSFRLGQLDAERMEREFFPVFNRFDMLNLPNWYAYASTLVNGQSVPPFTLRTMIDETKYDRKRAEKIRERSRQRYGKPRADVEAEIRRSLQYEAK